MDHPSPTEGAPDELIQFVTSPLDTVGGGTSQRAYNACKRVLQGFGIERLGPRYVALVGNLPTSQVDETMRQLNAALVEICADPMLVVADRYYWLGIADEHYTNYE